MTQEEHPTHHSPCPFIF